MRQSVAIADTNALPSAFVVLRGIEHSIALASEIGYQGIELALKHPDEIDSKNIQSLLDRYRMEISCISTGQVFADLGYSFLCDDRNKREFLIDLYKKMIDIAAEFSNLINIGRIRGNIEGKHSSYNKFIEIIIPICEYAAERNVDVILEPLNRYECDFINTLEEGAVLIQQSGMKNLKLMPDVFHMNIEEPNIAESLKAFSQYVAYVHLADSNRYAPGMGHVNFQEIFNALKSFNYDGWVSTEILPHPEPEAAAEKSFTYINNIITEKGMHNDT